MLYNLYIYLSTVGFKFIHVSKRPLRSRRWSNSRITPRDFGLVYSTLIGQNFVNTVPADALAMLGHQQTQGRPQFYSIHFTFIVSLATYALGWFCRTRLRHSRWPQRFPEIWHINIPHTFGKTGNRLNFVVCTVLIWDRHFDDLCTKCWQVSSWNRYSFQLAKCKTDMKYCYTSHSFINIEAESVVGRWAHRAITIQHAA